MLRLPSLIAIVLLAACANAPHRSPTLDAVAAVRLPDGHEALLMRRYIDDGKDAQGESYRRDMRYYWDYTAASAREVEATLEGEVVSDRLLPGRTIHATPEELAFATQLLRQDPRLTSAFTADTQVYGGFSYRDAKTPACTSGSRCIHVMGSRADGRRRAFHAIVDLQTATVVDPLFDPAIGGIDDPSPKEP